MTCNNFGHCSGNVLKWIHLLLLSVCVTSIAHSMQKNVYCVVICRLHMTHLQHLLTIRKLCYCTVKCVTEMNCTPIFCMFADLQHSLLYLRVGSKIFRFISALKLVHKPYLQCKLYSIHTHFISLFIFSADSVRGGTFCQCRFRLPYFQMSILWLSF